MKTIIMIALIAMSFSCVKQEVETEPINPVDTVSIEGYVPIIENSIGGRILSFYDTTKYWVYDKTQFQLKLIYSKTVKTDAVSVKLQFSKSYNGGIRYSFMSNGNITFDNGETLDFENGQYYVGSSKNYIGVISTNRIVKITYRDDYGKVIDVEFPSEEQGYFGVRFFKYIKEYESKN